MKFGLVPLTLDNYKEIIGENGSKIVSEEEVLYHENLRTSDTVFHRVAAVTSEGQLVGDGLAVTGPFDPTPKEGHFEIRVRVAEEWRNNGIGTVIYQEVSRFATEHAATALQVTVRDTCSHCLSFAERRGFEIYNHSFGSTLNIKSFDSSQFAQVPSLGHRLRIVSLADYPHTDEWFQRFVEFCYELVEDVPGMGGMTPSVLDLEKEKRKLTGGQPLDPHAVIIATVDDQWAALSFLIRTPDGNYVNAMTGVRRQYRGLRLGLAVKRAAVDYAKRQGANRLRTYNASINKPMLAINEKLGYQRESGVFALRKILAN